MLCLIFCAGFTSNSNYLFASLLHRHVRFDLLSRLGYLNVCAYSSGLYLPNWWTRVTLPNQCQSYLCGHCLFSCSYSNWLTLYVLAVPLPQAFEELPPPYIHNPHALFFVLWSPPLARFLVPVSLLDELISLFHFLFIVTHCFISFLPSASCGRILGSSFL